MTMGRTNGIWGLGLIILWGTPAMSEDRLFRDLGLGQARQAAAKEGKRLVLIDFYTDWCAPCKKLDETTWKDEGVRTWLSQSAVCLKVDAEKDEALAEKYRVNAYPTLLLLRPDGTEIDRLVGYRDAQTFLADARAALEGNDSLARARKKLDGDGRDDPMLRMNYGDALAQKGRIEDALSEYLWCFDHGLEHDRAFVGVRLSFLLGKIVQLGRAHPPALDELRKRRDSAQAALEGGDADLDTAMGFTALNDNLGEPARTLALYDRIKGDGSQPAQVRQYLFDRSLEQLLEARRYREVVDHTDPKARVHELIERHAEIEGGIPDDPSFRAFLKQQVCEDGAKYYEALVGAGERSGAAEVAALLAGFDPVDAYPAMITAAKRAGDAGAAEALAEEARKAAK
jgi:thiol-disulfide isomerase/thioredoxin